MLEFTNCCGKDIDPIKTNLPKLFSQNPLCKMVVECPFQSLELKPK